MSGLSCRFYKNEYPEIDSSVTIVVRNISDIGAYVNLLEYGNLEGMILLSELSRRRIRSVNKLVRVGKTESVMVIRVDADKKYIDLSKRRISPEDVRECEDRYIRAKTVYHIVLHSAEVMGIKTKPDLEHLMSETAWKFHEKFKNNGGAYEAFRLLLTQTSLLDDSNITPTQKEILISSIRHRFEPKKAKIRSDIEVTCYTHEGIESVRSALLEGIKLSIGAEAPVKINLISPPIYMVSTIVFDRDEGLRLMNNVVETIRTEIMLREGHFNLKLAPKIVTDIDEAELARQMENLERAKDPIDGDDLSSESESEEQVSQLMENRIES